MREIIKSNNGELIQVDEPNDLEEMTESLLMDARSSIGNTKTMSVPIAELSTLGAGGASLVPALNTVTTTTTVAADILELHAKIRNDVGKMVMGIIHKRNFGEQLKSMDGKTFCMKFSRLIGQRKKHVKRKLTSIK